MINTICCNYAYNAIDDSMNMQWLPLVTSIYAIAFYTIKGFAHEYFIGINRCNS